MQHASISKRMRGRSVSSTYIANIESGSREQPSVEVTTAIAKALGEPVDLALFLTGRVPAHWLEGDIDEIKDRFFELQRLAMGAPAVVRDKEHYPRSKAVAHDAEDGNAAPEGDGKDLGAGHRDVGSGSS